MELRRRELTEAASPIMIDYVATNLADIVFNHARFVFVDAVFLHCTGDTLPIAQALINLMKKEYEKEQKDENGKVSSRFCFEFR